jgi:Fic-DOC domain mobile mystery protein B
MLRGERHDPGSTPLSPSENEGLIPSLATQQELNEWERENILAAREWALSPRRLKRTDVFAEAYLRELHRQMFRDTWKWAGRYRTTERNLGAMPHTIVERVYQWLGDFRYWVEHSTYDIDEIAVRSHHRLLVIHPWPNGNGRHARLFADVVALKFGREEFSWGRTEELTSTGTPREEYLRAVRAADAHDFRAMLRFARA